MNSWERFSIGFVSSLLYPAIKVTQSSIDLTSFDAVFGGLLPCIFIGATMGFYAFLIEKKETDRERLFKQCVTIPAFVLGIAQGQSESAAIAQNHHVIECKQITVFETALRDSFAAISGNARTKYYLLSEIEKTNEVIIKNKRKYFVIGKYEKKPVNGKIIFNVDQCKIE